MKFWVIGLGLAFLYAAHATHYDFEKCDPNKEFPKTWYTQIFATNSTMLSEYLDEMSMVAANITITKDGNFNVSSTLPTPYGCLKMDVAFTKGEDGRYTCYNEWGKGVVLDGKTDCKSYCVVTAVHTRDGVKSVFLTLYGIEKIPTRESKQVFANLFAKMGLEEKYLVQFPPEVACRE
ncbi:extracellular fatty acid-binding protein-like [Zootoca vivipara]|uniref:extracellular fatty acid-binding protein-like n=1 Tax=Zootoca vivipara TaxID=8524 RepID=UPI00159013D4|nr:extracellular fatty acid-binding protein-like [Zootoca vivipara]